MFGVREDWCEKLNLMIGVRTMIGVGTGFNDWCLVSMEMGPYFAIIRQQRQVPFQIEREDAH